MLCGQGPAHFHTLSAGQRFRNPQDERSAFAQLLQQLGQSRLGNFESISVIIAQDKCNLTSRIQPKSHQVDVYAFVRRFDSADKGHAIIESRDLASAEKTESASFC